MKPYSPPLIIGSLIICKTATDPDLRFGILKDPKTIRSLSSFKEYEYNHKNGTLIESVTQTRSQFQSWQSSTWSWTYDVVRAVEIVPPVQTRNKIRNGKSKKVPWYKKFEKL